MSCIILIWYGADASKSGVAQETLQNAVRRGSKVMTEQEARQILGITEETSWEEVLKASISLQFFFLFFNYCCCCYMPCDELLNLFSHQMRRNMTFYSRGMRRMGAFTFSRRFTGLRNV